METKTDTNSQSPASNSVLIHSTQRSLPIALIRAREKVMGPVREMLATTGLTEQQWRVLRVLEEIGPMEPSRLAERAALHMPSQTRIVQTLYNKGYVDRFAHQSDRRKQNIAVTDSGKELIAEHIVSAKILMESFKTALGANKYDQLLSLLADVEDL